MLGAQTAIRSEPANEEPLVYITPHELPVAPDHLEGFLDGCTNAAAADPWGRYLLLVNRGQAVDFLLTPRRN